jgi:hypothetical protein
MLTTLGSFSSAFNKNTGNIIILPPTNITATNVTASSVTINFTPASGAITGYIATTNDGAQGSGTTSPITINGLANNTTYTVTVVSYALLNYSTASTSVSFTTVIPYTAGLKWWRYAGYANDVVTYTDTATLQAMSGKNSTGSGSVDFTNIGTATQQNQPPNAADYYTVLWLGYFFTGNNSGTFTFYTNSDDMSYLWIGPAALSGYTAANSVVNNAGLHGMATRSGTISLSANTYYPIRILFAENGGGDDIWVWFNLPGSSTNIYNGTGYYFTLGGGGNYSLVTTNTGIPSQPTVASITPGSTSAIVNFNQPTNVTTGSTYSLFYGSTVYGTATYPATSITATNLAPNTTYILYLTATNAYGTSIVYLTITTLTSPMFPIYEVISDTSSSILVNIVNIGASLSVSNIVSLLPAGSYQYTNTGYLFNITGMSNNTSYLLKSIASNPSGASNYALGQLTNTGPLITIATGASTVAFSYYGQYVCAACNGTGIYVSTNYGVTYNSVVSNTNVYSTAISDSGQFMFVGCSSVGQLYYSSNYGASFTLVTIGANISGVACSTSGANVYAIDYTNGGIYYSINYGTTWSSIVTVAANLSNLSSNFSGYIAYFTSTSTGNAYAYNLLTNSTTVYSPGGVANVSGIAVSANGQYVYICTYGGLCYTSTNGGSSFTSVPIIYLPSSNYQTILCDTTGQYVYVQNNTTTLYYSTNYGATFNTTVFPTSSTRISINSNSTILGITSGSGVYISTNSIVVSTAPGNPFPIVDASFGAPVVTTNSYAYYINSGFSTSAGYNYGVSIPGWQISYSNVAIAVANGSNTFFTASMPPATTQAFVLQVNGTYKTPPYCILYQRLYFNAAGSYTLNFCTIPGSSTSPTYINLTAILGNNSTSNTLTTSTGAWNYVTMPVTITTPGSYSLIFYFSTPNAYLNTAVSASIALTSIGFTATYLPATNLALTSASATSAIISFTAATTGGVAAASYTSSVGSGSGTPSAYTITGLSANTTYIVSLVANYAANYYGLGYSPAGSSVASSTVTFLTVPASPSLALVSVTTSSATIAITDVSGSTINSGYTLTTSPSGGIGSGPKTAYVITGLTSNTNYTFNVTTNNAAGSSVAATVSAATVPLPPTQLVATAVSDATATVTLTPPTGTATITQYTVTSSPGNITATSSSSTITVNGLSANTSYTFTATATNSGGTSVASSSSASITTSTAPNPPTNLSVTGTTSSTATVSFTPPIGSVNGYILSTSNGYQATGTTSPITITGLGASTIYTITIVAVNYNGSSNASSTVFATTSAGNYFSTDGSTLSGWTLGTNAIYISNTIGNPAPSIVASGNNASYGYYNLGYSFLNTTITFDVYVGSLCNIYFACNSSGNGQMFRAEGRGSGSGFASTSSWTGWNGPPGGTAFTTNRWYSVKIIISSSGVATWYQNNVLQSQSYTIANNGNYFGLQGDGGGGLSYYDNLIIAPTGGGGSSTPTNIGVPNQPIVGTVTTTLNSITVNFTQPNNVAAGSTYSLVYGGTTYGVANYPATTITASGLSQNTKYLLNLTATNSFGTSIPSTLITAITPLAGFNIGTATAITSTGATISFTGPVGAPATTVFNAIAGGVTYGTAPYTATSVNVTGLSPNTSYTFTVIASTGVSTTTSTGTVSITTLASTPSNVTLLSVSDTGASFSFTPSSGTVSAITYTITSSPGAITATSSASPIKIVGLSPNTNYTFTMTATNARGTTPASTPTSTITTGSVPLPPTNLSLASVTSSSITINFTPPVGTVTGFVATDLNGYQGSSTSSPITISGLTSGTIYTISIVSVDLNGVSSPSSTITATTTDILLSISNFQSTDISGIVVNNNVLYNVYVFKSTGLFYNINYTFGNNVTMYVLAVGGGGGGGEGGGGGGGGVVMQTLTVPPGTSSIYANVGYGGSGPVSINGPGSNGGDTTLSFSAIPSANIVAHGGGGGATGSSSIPASTGGSGGGGDFINNTLGASGNTADNNYASDGAASTYIDDTTGISGGGGGAGSSAVGQNGGSGIQCNLPGISTFSPAGTVYGNYYWGGGGGGITADGSQDVGNGGNGGAGGGGGGGVGNYSITNYPGGLGDLSGINLGGNALYANGGNGANNTGGGGGGGWSGYGGYGSYGGSGILILAYSGGGPNTTPTNVGVPVQPVVTSIASVGTTNTVTFLPPSNVSSGSTYTLFYGSTTYGTASYPDTTITATGLSPNTTYSLFLTATNAFGTSIPTVVISDTTGPAAPTIGSASTITASSATISFTAPAGAGVGTSYSAISGGVSYGSANYPATSVSITGLSSNTIYSFALTATNSNGTSAASSTVSFTTAPGPPTDLTASTVSDTIASIAFTTPSGNGTVISYTITSNPGRIVAINTASPITIGGLNANTTYTFTATATNIAGTSSSSAASNSTTTNSVPNPPTNPAVSTTAPTYITVSFTPAIGTVLYYVATTSTGIVSYSTASPITVSGLSASTSYTITVQSVDANGTSVASSSVTESTSASSTGTALTAPTITSATSITTTSCVLNFTAPSGAAAGTSYTAYVGSTVYNGSLYPATSITINGLSPNTAYAFTIKASNQYGYSAASNTFNVATVPLAPTSLSLVSETSGSVTLGFTAPSGNATISTYTAVDASGIYTGTSTTSPVTVTGLSPYSNYLFRVTATNTISTSVPRTFIPTGIANIVLWLDASDPLNNGTRPTNGSNLTTWYDKSGSGNNTASIYGTTPTYSLNNINGLPVYVMANGGVLGNFASNYTGTTYFVAMIVKFNAFNSFGRLVGLGNSTGNNDALTVSKFMISTEKGSFPTLFRNYSTSAFLNYSSNLSTGTPYLVTARFDGTNKYLGINGTYVSNASNDGNFNFTKYSLCVNSYSNAETGNYTYGEVLFYQNSLTTTQYQQIEGYLAWKWGVQTSLPTNHPYYSISPNSPTTTTLTGTSVPSSSLAVTTLLAAPTIGTATSITTTGATIGFTPPTGASTGTTYTISSNSVTYGTVSYPATSFVLNNLASNTSYSFTITATNNVGTSAASSALAITTVPGPPSNVSVSSSSDNSQIVTFTASTGNATVSTYTVTSSPGNIITTGSSSPITVTGLIPSTSYTYRVTATNSQGTSTPSIASGAFTTNAIPSPPIDLSASTVTPTYITVTFTPPLGTVSYYKASTSTGIVSYSTSSPVTISGLSASTSYTITIQSVDTTGTSVASSSITTSTTALSTGSVLTAPVVTSVSSVTKTSGALNFLAPSGASTGTSYTAYVGSTVYNGALYPSTTINVYGLTPNTTYGFTIKASNQYGYSGASLVLNLATLPLPPTDLSLVTVTSGSVTIGFTPPSGNSTISSYTATDASGIYIATNTVSPVTVTGLNPSTNYNFSITTTTTVSTYVPSTFNPATVAGMVLWLDASDPYNNGTQPANNANVTTWYDKSGGGRNGTATSGVTYTTNGLNNKPAFSFSGNRTTNAYYFCGNVSNTTPYITILAVVSLSSSAGGSGRVLSLSSGNGVNDYNNSSYLAFSKYLGTGIGPNRNNTVLQNNTYTSYSNPYVFETWCDNVNMYTTAQVGNNTTITSTSYSGNFNISYYCVGQNTNGTDTNATFSGYISEIIMFNTALSTSDRQKMEGYLSWKWGLQTNLPSSSPYYASSPTLPSLANVTGTSVPSSSLAVTTLLAAPTIGAATSITTTGATIGFTAPAGASTGTTYTISSSSVSYGTVSYPTTSFVLNNLTSNTTYSFTITATNSVGASAASSTLAVTTVPGPPSNVSVSISTNTAHNVTFTVPTGSATITGYVVTSSPGGLIGTGVSSPITVTGLSPNTSYTYRVTATNSQGTSAPSSQSSAVTTNSLPSPPTGLTASTTAPTYISVSFTPPLGAVSYYQVSTSTGITSYGTLSPITISGLSPGTAYTITIKTVDIYGTSVASSSITASTTGVSTGTALTAPTITSATSITTTSCVLNFTAPSGAASGTTYVVYVGATVYVSALYPDTSVTIYGLTPNTAYAFTMQASNIYGFSALSSVLNVATKPLAPTNISLVSETSSSVTIGFSAVSGNAVVSNYTATDASGTYIGTNTTSPITVNGLTSATNYSFTVTATNSISTSVTSTFNPTSLTGMILWLDATDPYNTGTPPASNAALSTWYDRSGSGNNATYDTGGSNTGATPSTNQWVSNGLNSLPSVFLYGNCRYYGNFSGMTNQLHIFGIASLSSTSQTYGRLIGMGNGTIGVSDPLAFCREGGTTFNLTRPNTDLVNNAVTYGNPYLWEAWYDGTNANTVVFIGNGTSIKSVAYSSNLGYNLYSIGSAPTRNDNTVGYFSEMMVYKNALSTTDRQKIEGYLSWKWGLQANLPTTHPYYSASPSSPTVVNITGTSVPSSALAVTTYIGAPTIVSVASITATTAVITFTAPARSATGTTYSAIAGGITYGTAAYPATTITVTGLSSNTNCSLTMTATTSAGTSAPSNTISFTTLPGSPQSLVASLYSDTVAFLNFNPPTGNATITGYIGYSSPGNMTVTGTTSPLIVTGLLPNTSYSFTMTATNSQGTSARTNPTGYITTKSLPVPPTNLQVIGVTPNSVTIGFIPCLGTVSYYIATTNTGINTYSTTTPIVVSGLSPSTTYTVTMRTVDAYGTSAPQVPFSITTISLSNLNGSYPTPSFTYDVNYNVITSGSNVISWGDTNNAILATAPGNRPVLTTNYVNTYNSIVFSQGTNQVLTTSSLSSTALANISSITIFFVMKVPSFNSMENFFSSTGPWAPGSLHLILNPTGYFQISFNSTINDFVTTTQVPLNTPFILMVNLGNLGGLMTSYLRLNGIQSSIFVHNPYAMNINTTTLDFGGWSQGGRTINGGISQIVIYNRNLQESEIRQTEYFLSTRWNISIYNSILFAPTNLSVSSVSMSSAIISFTPPIGASTGTIYTATANSIIYGTASYPATTILLENLPANTTLIFTVTTTNVYGTSPASSGLVFTTLPGTLANLTLVSSSTYLLNLSFTPASGQNTVSYSSSIGTGSGTPAAYVVSGLNPATSYTFNIVTTNSAGSTNTSITASTALPPPTGLYASAVTATAATVYFTAPIQVTSDASFSLFISNSFIGSVKYPITSFPLSGLTTNTTYPMTIVSSNSAGSSIPSSVLYVTTLPTAPSNITVISATVSTIVVSFTPPSGNSIVGYSLTTGIGYGTPAGFTIPNLIANSSYTFSIIATNSAGSASSAPVTIYTPLPPPTSLSASSITIDSAIVSFTPPTGAASGTIYTIRSGGVAYGTSSYPVTAISATGLSPNSIYSFTITSTNVNNAVSVASTSVAVTTLPTPPTNLAAYVASNTVALITFTASSGNGTITAYTVTSSPGGITSTGTTNSVGIGGLVAGTAYTFTVTATNSQGTSTASSATSPITINPTNSSIITSASFITPTTGGQISIGSISGTYTSFNITRTGGTQGTFAAIGQTGTSYTDPTVLTNNTQYTYTITPVANGVNSTTFTAITNPNNGSTPGSIYTLATVTGLNLTYSGATSSVNSVYITWTNNGYTTLYLANTTKSGARYTASGIFYNSTTNGSSDLSLNVNTQYTYTFTTQNGDGYYVSNPTCQATVVACTWGTCTAPTFSGTTTTGTTLACTGTFSGIYITFSGGSATPTSGTTVTGTNSISQTYTGMSLTTPYTYVCYPVNANGYTSSNSATSIVSNPYDGLSSATAAPSAAFLAAYGNTTNGVYWINLPTVGATQIYCILDRAVDGGGWMMAMKATRGTTFQYSANYWTTNNTLNPANANRNDGDAKFNTMNYSPASDIMALWPDVTTVGGSLNLTGYSCWAWLQNRFTSAGTFYTNAGNGPVTTTVSGITAAMTIIDWFTKISSVRYFIQDAITWPGWGNAGTIIFSSQTDVRFYGFNYTSNRKSRWGFGWNENGGDLFPYGNMGSDDVTGGIGTETTSYSAGDVIGCCQNRTGFNRSARVEVYIRDSSSAPSAPTIGTASKSGSTVTITFTGVTGAAYYTAFSSTGGFSGSSTSSPITITGVSAGTYTFTVKASSSSGTSLASAASNSLTV